MRIKKAFTHAITTYLDIKKSDFYRIESTIDGVAVHDSPWLGGSFHHDQALRGARAIKVDENLIGQYIQHEKTAKGICDLL